MNRILWNKRGGCIDEIVIENVEAVHVEQMNDREWWIGIYLPPEDDDGEPRRWSGFFVCSRGDMSFVQQDDDIDWDEDRSHDPGDDKYIAARTVYLP